MANFQLFLAIAVMVPVVVALLCFLVNDSSFRRILIIMMAALLGISAYWLHTGVGVNPVFLSFPGGNLPLTFLNSLLLFYILYVGITRNHKLVIGFAALQLIALGYIVAFVRPDVSVISSFMLDRLSVVMYLVVAVVASLICLFALKYMEKQAEMLEVDRNGRFFLWFILLLAAMNGLIFANNLLWLYFFWEVTTLCSFQLIGHDDTEEARGNALHALYLNSLGGAAMIAGILLLVTRFSGTSLSLVDITDSSLGLVSPLFVLVLSLLMVASFIKAAQFPFQGWLLGAMAAPTPVLALLHSSTVVKAGVYLAVRLAPAYDGTILSTFVALVGAFTFFAASWLAVGADKAQEALTYSTVANLGLITACCGLNLPLSLGAAVLLIIFHAVSSALLFATIGVTEHRLGSRNIKNMEGLVDRMPGMAFLMTMAVFTMFLPPFGMLFGKWASMAAAGTFPLVMILFIAASTFTTWFWTRWMGYLLTGTSGPPAAAEPKVGRERLNGYYAFVLGALSIGTVGLSLGMGAVINELVSPALVFWYPLSFLTLGNGNIVIFSWASFFNPNLATIGLAEGLFPVGLLFAALLLTVVVFWLGFRSERERVSSLYVGEDKSAGGKREGLEEEISSVYLSGENWFGDESQHLPTVTESEAEVLTGEDYFIGFAHESLQKWLNLIAAVLLALMIGVIFV